MSELAEGAFEVTSWDETPLESFPNGGKLTRARLVQTYTGGLEGVAASEWLMAYRDDGAADFVGHQRVEGSLGGRSGVFVLEVVGHFDGRVASGELTAVTGCGSGDVSLMKGAGHFSAELGPTGTYELDYVFLDAAADDDGQP